jgi:hypothetical protein
MKRLIRKIEAMFTAVAFAEEGDAETARRIVAESSDDVARRPRPDGGHARNDAAVPRRIRPLAKSSGA